MRPFFSGRRYLGIRPGVSFGPEDLRSLSATQATGLLLPFWTNMSFVAAWLGSSAWVVLTMETGPYLLAGQIIGVLLLAAVVGGVWLFLTLAVGILRLGRI